MDEDTADGAVPAGTPETNGTGTPETDVVAAEPSAPALDDARSRLRAYLGPEESLRTVAHGTLVDDPQGTGVVGVTDDRFLAVTDAGSLLTAGFDRVRSVRCHTVTLPVVRGLDARLAVAVGFLAALVGFSGVLATATSPLTPPLAFLAAGGALALTHLRFGGVAVESEPETLESLRSAFRAVRRRVSGETFDLDAPRAWLREHAGETRLTTWAGGGAVGLSLALSAAVESGLGAPLFALATAGGVALVVFGFYHGRTFDRLAVDWRHERAVTVALDDGTTVTVRTDTDADLDRQIAAQVGERRSTPGTDRNRPTRSGGDSKRTNWTSEPDGS
jgi:hypothetical protein